MITTYGDFIQKIGQVSVLQKPINNNIFIDENKYVRDNVVTPAISNLLFNKLSNITDYLYEVYKKFNTYNGSFYIPDIFDPSTNTYRLADFSSNPPSTPSQLFRGYFIFKGGNAIKYNITDKYFSKFNFMQDALREYHMDQFRKDLCPLLNDNPSDFDFSYYVYPIKQPCDDEQQCVIDDDNKFQPQHYKNLCENTAYRLLLLRDAIQKLNIIDYDTLNQYIVSKYENVKPINKYITDKLPDSMIDDAITTNIINDITNLIIYVDTTTNKIQEDKLNENNKQMNVSFNASIHTDKFNFDLLRIMYNIKICSESFKGEIFDLSFYKYDDRFNVNKDFIKNSHKFVEKLTIKHHDPKIESFVLYTYNSTYFLYDILFTLISKPNIFLWNDSKWEKRIPRLCFLLIAYIEYISDNTEKVGKLYLLKFLLELDLKQQTFDDCIRNAKNLYIANYQKLLSKYKIDINDIFNYYDKYIATLSQNSDATQQTIFNSINFLHDTDNFIPVESIINLILLYIKKIYYEKNVIWCNFQYKPSENNTIDFYLEKLNTFLKLFFDNILNAIECILTMEHLQSGGADMIYSLLESKQLKNKNGNPIDISRKNINYLQDRKEFTNIIKRVKNMEQYTTYCKNNIFTKENISIQSGGGKKIYNNYTNPNVDSDEFYNNMQKFHKKIIMF